MRIAKDDLGLDKVFVIYPGTETYEIDRTAEVWPLSSIPLMAESLRGGG